MSKKITLWLAELDTEHFNFTAYGSTKANVERVMHQAWNRHRRQTGASDRWADVVESVGYQSIAVGCAYRDGNPL